MGASFPGGRIAFVHVGTRSSSGHELPSLYTSFRDRRPRVERRFTAKSRDDALVARSAIARKASVGGDHVFQQRETVRSTNFSTGAAPVSLRANAEDGVHDLGGWRALRFFR